MDRAAPPTPQQRDMVYCHQCENEWYRDEHGLTCPECLSDFTEIIEPDHDPRYDEAPPPANAPAQPPPHIHREFYGEAGAPDPGEEDIGNITWRQTGPDTWRASINRTIDITPGQRPQQGQSGSGGGILGGILGAVTNMIGGALGVGEHQQPQQQGVEAQHGQDAQPEQRPQSPDAGQNRSSSAPGAPRNGTTVRHFHGPNYHMSIMTSSSGNLFPRNANAPQPFQNQPDHIEQMMAQMLMNIGVPPQMQRGGGPAGGAIPVGMGGPGVIYMDIDGPGFAGGVRPPVFAPIGLPGLFQLFAMPPGMAMGNGQFGDAVFSQEALDRIITQLMEQHQSGHAPGPASEAAIKALPKREINEKDLGENGTADCSICMDEVLIGETVTELPCHHWFHGDCIKAWLSEHDTCPHCRQGIMPKEGGGANAERPREPSQPPLNDTHSPEYHGPRDLPGGFPAAAFNRQNSSYGEQEASSSGRQDGASTLRRASSTPGNRPSGSRQGSSNGELFQRMRSAFSGGSGDEAASQQQPGGSNSSGGGHYNSNSGGPS